jgi:hypothetical protein
LSKFAINVPFEDFTHSARAEVRDVSKTSVAGYKVSMWCTVRVVIQLVHLCS